MKLLETEITAILESASSVLLLKLEMLIVTKMQEKFGHNWKKNHTSNLDLKAMLESIISSYSDFLQENHKRIFVLLLEKSKQTKGVFHVKEERPMILSVIQEVLKVTIELTKWPTQENLNFKDDYVRTTMKIQETERALESMEAEKVYQAFNRIWKKINQLTGLVLDAYHIPNCLNYQQVPTGLKNSEIQKIGQMLIKEVEIMKMLLQKILIEKDAAMANIHALNEKLKNFFPEIKELRDQKQSPYLTAFSLKRFLQKREHRIMLENGMLQLQQFLNYLKLAL